MNLKGILKTIKLNESTISTVLGVLVVLVVGILVINYFRGMRQSADQAKQVTSTSTENVVGGKHTVAQGETLWKIAEKYYGSGYNWTDIATENKLTNPGQIDVGQMLSIPKIGVDEVAAVNPSPAQVIVPNPTASPMPTISPGPTSMPQTALQGGSEYTIAKGDSLWKIAVRTYGDGYAWTKIWQENKQIKNPNLIFVGNNLILPTQ